MKYNVLAAMFLALAMNSCDNPKPGEKFFSFDDSKFKSTYKNGENVSLGIENPQGKAIDSIAYFVNGKRTASVKGGAKSEYVLTNAKFGYQNLKAIVYFEGETIGQEIESRVEVVSHIEPRLLNYTVVRTYPHDTVSFTEGLEFYNNSLYESTGQNGKSYVRKVDLATGKALLQADLEQQYFGEGITIVNHQLFYLTWQSNVGFIYDPETLKRVSTFSYDKKIEGWGMTNDGKVIYQSDGTEKIWTMDPKTQKMLDFVNVYSTSGKIKSVNELEYVDGKIYGNIWQKDALAVIDPKTGAVEAIVNLVNLRKELKNPASEVLNGIAYNKKTNTFFVTGKNWDKMFEIKIFE
ncbi:glutaminyl-peptide cyclotransferase [Flavobacterium selenitireducens]|uniref:glutaminyl-peptide cyclotransferase n=1 Tax=Flavobacterium selenitireducens TaxID=2722704 RepID=UPI00168BE1FF|nr:glutaminyl-peptide cyclotransferase [Flavobacterium selenitireducens]MBD3581186.1 glutaminyl-peptide cyclotransferase [Flavobacterium selenitireducens]